MKRGYLNLLFLVSLCHQVFGHGRLMDPPARNTLWRFGFINPVNYNDNELFCGGFGVQYQKNGGKCGVCGDSYDEYQPREHEAGGTFGNGIIAREYVVGQKMTIELDITANHWGYFEIKLCPINDKTQIVTQECLDKYPLYLAKNPMSSKFYVPKEAKKKFQIKYKLLLPQDVTCSQCVIQWTYHTGNTWGKCENGTKAVGCGDQEMFRNCADIKIRSNTGGRPPLHFRKPIDNPNAIYFRDKNYPGGRRPMVVRSQICVPTEMYERTPELPKWCQQNCLKYPPACNRDMCKCLSKCEAIGEIANEEGADVWCHRQCLIFPSKCPKDLCRCFEEDPNEKIQVIDDTIDDDDTEDGLDAVILNNLNN